jgi:predicted dienelactone hydrolase
MKRLVFTLALLFLLQATTHGQKYHAGTATRIFHASAGRELRGAPDDRLRCIIWYPAAAELPETPKFAGPPDAPFFRLGTAATDAPLAAGKEKFPLVLLSHGSGGSSEMLAWMGISLARAGFIAVAVDHPGNNSHQPYTAQGFVLWWERAADLSEVLDAILKDAVFGPRIDRNRIGAAGHSIGGYTVMELAGARTDFSVIEKECHQHPDSDMCRTPEMHGADANAMAAEVKQKNAGSLARSGASYRDPRVKAVFAMAPAQGLTLTTSSLSSIDIPVELVVGDHDTMTPVARNAGYVHDHVPGSKLMVLRNVGHYTFIGTCIPEGAKTLGPVCADSPGIQRDAIHARVAEEAVHFFTASLQ